MTHDYFTADGHLTEDAFQVLTDGGADELLRLEISEHLSFCDECIVRYSEYMSDDALLTPPEYLTAEISRAVIKCSLKDNVSRYFWVCIAACFAITLWVNGVFTPDIGSAEKYEFAENTEQITRQTQNLSRRIADGITDFLNNHRDIYNQYNK